MVGGDYRETRNKRSPSEDTSRRIDVFVFVQNSHGAVMQGAAEGSEQQAAKGGQN